MKHFIAVLTWRKWYGYESAVYRVMATSKSSAKRKARLFGVKTLELSNFDMLIEEVTSEKALAIYKAWEKLSHEFDRSNDRKIWQAYHNIRRFWLTACFEKNFDNDACEI